MNIATAAVITTIGAAMWWALPYGSRSKSAHSRAMHMGALLVAFTIAGSGLALAADEPPVFAAEARASTRAGDLYARGTRWCASTYPNHPAYNSQFGGTVDINASGGDYNRLVVAPVDGKVEVVTTGYGRGWGTSIIFTTADGTYRLHIAHLIAVLDTGRVSAGDPIARAGNTGHVDGSWDHGGSHLHVSASLNGEPARVELSGSRIYPGRCYTSRGPEVTNGGGSSGGLAPISIVRDEPRRWGPSRWIERESGSSCAGYGNDSWTTTSIQSWRNADTNWFTWDFNVPSGRGGHTNVEVYIPRCEGYATVTYAIYVNGRRVDTETITQARYGARWVRIDTLRLEPGDRVHIRLGDRSPSRYGTEIVADAIRLRG